jgi:hypothetical protein
MLGVLISPSEETSKAEVDQGGSPVSLQVLRSRFGWKGGFVDCCTSYTGLLRGDGDEVQLGVCRRDSIKGCFFLVVVMVVVW